MTRGRPGPILSACPGARCGSDMDSSIRQLFEAGKVTAQAAYDKAIDKEQFKKLAGGE